MMQSVVSKALPDGWVECSVEQVTLPAIRIDPKEDPDREVQYIDISGVDNVRNLIRNTKRYRLRHAPSRDRQVVRAGDTLFSTVRPYLRNIAMVPSYCDQEIASTAFSVLRPVEGVCPGFLFYKALSSDFVNQVSGMQYGVSYPAVNDEQVRDQSLWLPPTAEQYRIVTKIDELCSELDAGIESLKNAHAQLEMYRQAVLQHTFEGKLTAQWREENKDRLNTRRQLLAILKQKRVERHEQQLRDWQTAVAAWNDQGRRGEKPRKPKKLPTVMGLAREVLSTLPSVADAWTWQKIAWMTCGVEYGTAAKSAPSGEVPVLRMGNIRRGQFDWSDLVYTSDYDEAEKYRLHDGDVLFHRTNSPELVGKTAIYRGSCPAIFAGYLIRINHISSVVDGQFLNFYLNSHVARRYGNTVKTDGVNQSNINGAKLLDYPFPYCSIEEQRETVSNLDSTFSHVDELENEIARQLELAAVLRQAILKRAFSGQLVPQDPNDEPASVLLDRIRREREQIAKREGLRRTEARNRASVAT